MKKTFNIILSILLILFLFPYANAAEKRQRTANRRTSSRRSISPPQANMANTYYDLGVFAYEDGNYEEAERYLTTAIKLNPNNPFYNHYLGKTYIKTGRFREAKNYLNLAWKVNPNIPGLKFDLAFLNYNMGDYSMAAGLFMEITKEDPLNILAYYYAGINLYEQKQYKKALKYLIHAAHESPSIKTNGYYYIGICYLNTGKIKEALEKFEYVRDHSEPGPLKENALEWIKASKLREKPSKPYNIYLKISYRYDDDIRFEEDIDFYKEANSYFYFSGDYNLFNTRDYNIGVRYNHYQTWDSNDDDEYDLTGSILNLFGAYRFCLFTLRLNYLSHYYLLNSVSYVTRHQLKPEVIKRINKKIIARLSYSYYDNNYFRNNYRDGHTSEFFLETLYTIIDKKADLFAIVGYADNAMSDPDYSYNQLKTNLGFSLKIPWDLLLNLTTKYSNKIYKNPDSFFKDKREDNRYYGSISLSRKIFHAWLNIIAEFNYTKNDSNFNEYEYERRAACLSIAASY